MEPVSLCCEEYFQSYADQYQPADYGGFVCEFHTEVATENDSCDADEKCDYANNNAGEEGFFHIVFGNRKSYGKGIDGGSDALDEKDFEAGG